MNYITQIKMIVAGAIISISAQYFGGLIYSYLPVSLIKLDPAIYILYTSLGLSISLIAAMYLFLKKKYSMVAGIVLGLLLWWPILIIGMAATNTWL